MGIGAKAFKYTEKLSGCVMVASTFTWSLLSNAGTGGKLVLQGSILTGYRWTSGLTSGTQGMGTAGPSSVRHMQSGWDGVQFDSRDTGTQKFARVAT